MYEMRIFFISYIRKTPNIQDNCDLLIQRDPSSLYGDVTDITWLCEGLLEEHEARPLNGNDLLPLLTFQVWIK